MASIEQGGSVFKRASDGRWCAQVIDPLNGRQVRKYAATKAAAQRLLAEMLVQIERGESTASGRTRLVDYAREWVSTRAGRKRRESTVAEYQRRLEAYILPILGGRRMSRITPVDVERLLDDMHEKGYSKETMRSALNALSAVLTDAKRENLIATNPCKDIEMHAEARQTEAVVVPSREVILALIESASDSDPELARLLTVLAASGMRIGEALALTVGDVDVRTGRVSITRTVTIDRDRRVVLGDAGKTRSANRVITVGRKAREALAEQRTHVRHMRMQASRWPDHDSSEDLIFGTSVGTVADPRAWRKRLNIVAKAVPDWHGSFHQLRHYGASVMLATPGATPAAVAKVLGHKTSRTTEAVYGHLLGDVASELGDAMDAGL